MWPAWERKVYKILVEKSEGERPLERRDLLGFWDQNGSSGDWLRMCVEWIKLALDMYRCRTVVHAVMNLWVLSPRS
jgi:hypothetical protein